MKDFFANWKTTIPGLLKLVLAVLFAVAGAVPSLTHFLPALLTISATLSGLGLVAAQDGSKTLTAVVEAAKPSK